VFESQGQTLFVALLFLAACMPQTFRGLERCEPVGIWGEGQVILVASGLHYILYGEYVHLRMLLTLIG